MKNSNGDSKPVENEKENVLTFRKAIERSEEERGKEEKIVPKKPQAPTLEAEESKTPTPIALYEELKGVPYTAFYFQIEKIWDDPDLSYEEDVRAIEDYYKQKVASGEIEDSKEAYESLIREGEKITKTKNSSVNVKLAKIAEFFRFMTRLDKIDKERKRWR